MRDFLVTIGLPGSGKSTFLSQNQLSSWTISPDYIRTTMGSPRLTLEGNLAIRQDIHPKAWEEVFRQVETRGQEGALIIVDATHLNSAHKTFETYIRLLRPLGYRFHYLDFTDVPVEQCLQNNLRREPEKVVPEMAIRRMLQQKQNLHIPSLYHKLDLNDISSFLQIQPQDLSSYRQIHHIGDLQGCYTPLAQYFAQHPFRKDDFYIFAGDYIDRGEENAEVLKFLHALITDNENIVLVEGNHERYLRLWLNNQSMSPTNEFMRNTLPQMEKGGVTKGEVGKIVANLQELFYYKYRGKAVLVTHGGLTTPSIPFRKIPTQQIIHGVGQYHDVQKTAETFTNQTNPNTFQIFGHRNPTGLPTLLAERNFLLEGQVEYACGALRGAILSDFGWEIIDIPTNSQKINPRASSSRPNAWKAIPQLQKLSLHEEDIAVRAVGPHIISLSLNKAAQFKGRWSQNKLLPRGLFINSTTGEIVARGYPKFFNINEQKETLLASLVNTFSPPLVAYRKENGYLGLVGYDREIDDLFVASKTTANSPFAAWLKEMLAQHLQDNSRLLTSYLKKTNSCLVFEVVLPELDPHIVQYSKGGLYLLDILDRTLEFKSQSELSRIELAQKFNFDSKQKVFQWENFADFSSWASQEMSAPINLSGPTLEGYVIEDFQKNMVKLKTPSYWFWRHLRTQLQKQQNGGEARVDSRWSEKPQREFLEFTRRLPKETSLIKARELWLAHRRTQPAIDFF